MSKDDIEKLDKQIELLKKDKEGKPTGEVETVVTEIHDSNDPNHVINIDYGNSEVKESTKELKDLKTLTTEVEEKVENTKEIPVTKPLDAIVENEVEEIPAKVDDNVDNKNENNSSKKTNNKLFIILGVIFGLLVLVFIICLFVFNGDDKNDDKPVDKDVLETENTLSKEDMIKTIDLYGKTLESEVTKYYNQNNKLPDFSTVNNLVDLEYEVVCHIHEIYEDKTVYLDECMVDYTDIAHSYGTKKDINKEVVDNNNIKVYVHKKTKKATLEVPANLDDYYLYSSNVDTKIQNIQLLDGTSYLIYLDESTYANVLYNYVLGKKGFYKIDYKSHARIQLFSENYGSSVYIPEYSSEYIILHFEDASARVYSLITGEPVGEKYNIIRASEVAPNRIVVGNDGKYGVLNLKNNNLVLPLEYREIYNSGSSIVAKKNEEVFIFDKDGNRYLEDDLRITSTAAVYDKYILNDYKVYNLNGKVMCKFDSEEKYILLRNRVSADQLIYHVNENNVEKCYIYNINEKDCTILEKEDCYKIY